MVSPIGMAASSAAWKPMEVEVKGESCLQRELHSRIFRVSEWRVWARASRRKCDSAEFEKDSVGLRRNLAGDKSIGGLGLMAMKR